MNQTMALPVQISQLKDSDFSDNIMNVVCYLLSYQFSLSSFANP